VADDKTILNWWAPRDAAVDVYRGTIAAGVGKGSVMAGGFWQYGSGTSCFIANKVPGPGDCTIGCNGTSGALNLTTDPNPGTVILPVLGPAATAVYYVMALNAPSGSSSVNALGCANPAVCMNGPTPGLACSSDSQCGAGGTCLSLPAGGLPVSGFNACPANGDVHKSVAQVIPANLCP